jgi:putative membrane protein
MDKIMTNFNLLIQQMNNPQHMMDGWGGFGITFMIIFWILVVALVVTLIWFLVQKGSSKNASGESALDILKKRYARGEIDDEKYQHIIKRIDE